MPPSNTASPTSAVALSASPRQLLSGTEAIVRLMLEQRERDARAGLRTAGFISGYRGSPLGTLDMALWEAAEALKAQDIHFVPGVNEDLAATALWGSQYVGRFDGARVDGVFGLWYGKGPGVDRSGDALKHGNLAGSSPQGGALVLAGDDHAAKSSTTAHQSEPALIAAGIPVLYPADVSDIVHLGLHGLAMSRASGCWVGLKLVTDVVETTATVDLGAAGPSAAATATLLGTDALASRIQDPPRAAEERLMRAKLPAVLDYAATQGLNRICIDAPGARRGLLTAGKSYGDTRQALELLGLDEAACAALGLRLMKLDLVWPLHPGQIAAFAQGLDSILVVEEKRAVIEDQLKALLYDLPADAARPAVLGKRAAAAALGGAGENLLPTWGDLDPLRIARVLAGWLGLPLPEALAERAATTPVAAPRLPSFCSGCPHSSSTRVPEGSRALAGIGCHGMATIKQPGVTTTMSQMGGEGAMWIGQAPFTTEPHVFTNMGDGTWFHSGALAVRAAVAAKVNITYKILVNGFVSMTGGQPIDGEMSVPKLLGNLQAEGVAKVVLVTDDVAKYQGHRGQTLPGNPPVRDRHELDVVQRELRELPGVTVIVYEQPCATERRRLRKRGQWPDPAVRTFIHPAVCEGCGDCGRASDCLSVEPLETPFGRKRRINQSSCNKDRTCVDGFCPSFVTVHGGTFKGGVKAKPSSPKAAPQAAAPAEVELPLPSFQPLTAPLNLLFAGVGGTGVVTASSVLARAAQLQGLEVSVLDVTGLSQKYGAVQSHLRLAPAGQALPASRIAPGQGDLLIGCDLLVGGEPDTVDRLRAGRATSVVNSSLSPAADFTRNPDWQVDEAAVRRLIDSRCSASAYAPASTLAEQLLGDAIGANLLLLGMAWQRGWVPVTLEAIEQAIRSQGGAAQNLKAFTLGRRAAHDPAWAAGFEAGQAAAEPPAQPIQIVPFQPRSLAQWLDLHGRHLQAYGGAALAARHRRRIEALAAAERQAGGNGHAGEPIAIAAARGYYKLLAHKDEFEVARLLTDVTFRAGLEAQFDGPVQLHLHLGGGALARTDPVTGQPVKTELRGWIWPALRLLARLRGLRGTWLDPWRHGAERRLAQEGLQRYEQDLDRIATELARRPGPDAHAALLRLARVPDRLRGYGHVREQLAVKALAEREAALQALAALHPATLAAAA